MTTELPQTPPPTAPRTGLRGRPLAILLALVLVAAAAAAVLLWPAHRKPAAAPPPSPSASPSPSPSPSASKALPYPFFPVGTCFDHPQLSKGITEVVARPCEGPHDGESIANPRLPDGLTKDLQISAALLMICRQPAADWTARQGGGTWYGMPMAPPLSFYNQGMRDVTCALAGSDVQGGTKLTGHLKS